MSGEGTIVINGQSYPVRAGDVVRSNFAIQLHWLALIPEGTLGDQEHSC
jgi:hypothetical protein